MKAELEQKAEARPVKDLTDALGRARTTLQDLQKQAQFTAEQLLKVDRSAHIEDIVFKISLLDRRLSGLEGRVCKFQQDQQLESSYSRVINTAFTQRHRRQIKTHDEATLDQELGRPPKTSPSTLHRVYIRSKKK